MKNANFDISVDFSRKNGKINKQLHGSNSGPVTHGRAFVMNPDGTLKSDSWDFKYASMGFVSARTHDWGLWAYCGGRVCDTHYIFPLEHLDPADERNYFFRDTDNTIKNSLACGNKIFFRLGTSIEHTSSDQHSNTIPPKDFHHYAEVCAGIVRHYMKTFGAENMPHWEIWNEPDLGERMWLGTREEFIELFVIVLKRLKFEFPYLQVGGPGLCGFKEDWIRPLLQACKDADIAPDFLSFHAYGGEPKHPISRPAPMRALLDEYGFTKTQVNINEWHYVFSWTIQGSSYPKEYGICAYDDMIGAHGIDSAAFNVAVLCGWHDEPIDFAHYYGASPRGNWGFCNADRSLDKNYWSMKCFGDFIKRFEDRATLEVSRGDLYALAGVDGEHGEMLIADWRSANESISINVAGMKSAPTAMILDRTHNLAPIVPIVAGDRVILPKNEPGSAVFVVQW